jgi:hypothetical protein
MTITAALSPARDQAFHTTQSAQSRRHGEHVQFSLPPVDDPTARGGSGTPTPGTGHTLLPIAVPIAALNDLATATPLPTAGAAGGGPASAIGTTVAGAVHAQGNLVSARLISRLYEQGS